MFLLDAFSPAQLTTIAAAYFIAALVKGVTGLGYSSTCLPILTLAFGLKEALPMVLIPSVASNLVVLMSTGGFLASAQRFWPMVLSAAASVFAGLWALTRMRSESAAAVLGVVLLMYVGFALANARFRLSEARTRRLEPAIGAATGFVNGLTGSQVMPLLPYLLSLDIARERFLQASNQSFTLSSIAMFIGLGMAGLMTVEVLTVSAFGLVLVALGVRIGQRIGRHLAPQAFRTAVLIVLAALGLGLILRAAGWLRQPGRARRSRFKCALPSPSPGCMRYPSPRWPVHPLAAAKSAARSTASGHFWRIGLSGSNANVGVLSGGFLVKLRPCAQIATCLPAGCTIRDHGAAILPHFPPRRSQSSPSSIRTVTPSWVTRFTCR